MMTVIILIIILPIPIVAIIHCIRTRKFALCDDNWRLFGKKNNKENEKSTAKVEF